jgi:hypothetical protein
MASTLLEALAGLELAGVELAAVEPAGLELELELELLVHPAVPSRPAVRTVAPSQVAVRRLKMFIKPLVRDASDAWGRGIERAREWPMTRRRPNLAHLLKAPFARPSLALMPSASNRAGLPVKPSAHSGTI